MASSESFEIVDNDADTSAVDAGLEKTDDDNTSEVHVTVAKDEDTSEVPAGNEKADDADTSVAVIQVASVMRTTPT